MKYKHIQVFRVYGFSNPVENEITFFQDSKLNVKAIFSHSLDDYCFEIDRRNAISSLIFTRHWAEKDKDKIPKAIEEGIKRVQNDRKVKIRSGAAIVLAMEGEIENLRNSIEREFDEFTISIAELHDSDIKTITTTSIYAKHLLFTSLFLAANHSMDIKKVDSGLYLTNHENKIYYPISISLSTPNVFCSESLNEAVAKIKNYFDIVKKEKSLNKVYRLLSQAIDSNNDNLKSFIYSWTALEILINKIFNVYEKEFLNFLAKSSKLNASRFFICRISEIMKDKYKLHDKFVIITSFFKDEEAEIMSEQFKNVKKYRDKMFHGEDIEEATLPTDDVIKIIKIYLKAHIDKLAAQSALGK